jgi:DNA-directed RNA polymerase beta' subunit
MQGICEIDYITFGVYSADEIRNMSVAEINKTSYTGDYGTVYDPRLGTIDNRKICETCNQGAKECPGHFGHIELNQPIIHPLFYKTVREFLSCFCLKCNRLLILKEQIELDGIDKYKGQKKFQLILGKLEKIDECCHDDCRQPHPDIKYNISDGTMVMIYKKKNTKVSIVINVEEIYKLFDSVSDYDIEILGFDPKLVHPRNYILTVFPVIPPCARPYVITEGNMCDDDLTNQIQEIVKANNYLDKEIDYISTDSKRQKYVQSLKFRISTFYNNSQGKAKHTTNRRPIKGLKERITGKKGLIRDNLMGKRCEQTARTVAGGDPTLKFGQLGVPQEFSDILTIPVQVTSFNIIKLTNLVNNDGANYVIKSIHPKKKDKYGKEEEDKKNIKKVRINLKYACYKRGTDILPGDVIIRYNKRINVISGKEQLLSGDKILRNKLIIDDVQPTIKINYKLNIGDIVERKLQDGDIVLLNRQPTLHKASMQAMEVKLMPYKTFRMNLANTKPFNCDFDGDELNIHVAQSIESQTELRMLSASKHNIISSQSSKPYMAIVQDSLVSVYRMTLGIKTINKCHFYDICTKLEMRSQDVLNKIQHIRKVLKNLGKKTQCFTGKGLISLILPDDLIYEKENKANQKEPILKIFRGVLYEGTLDKNILGSNSNSLIHILHKEYGPDRTCKFIDEIQFIANSWLLIEGFSVGIDDCLVKGGTEQEKKIEDVIQRCYIEAETIKQTTNHPIIRELRINASLSKAKDMGLRIAKDSLSNNNNFLSTVKSGSKGDFFNIAQITGLLGQQNLQGQRVSYSLNHNKRTLPHYPFSDLTLEQEYESRGFIASSFIKGLNEREFYFHAMSGREGVCDTAMGTAKSGYMQRKIVKLTEDIKIQYDGTVRDTTGKIYQLAYGNNGLDPVHTVKVDNEQQVCDISRIANRLNMLYENKLIK